MHEYSRFYYICFCSIISSVLSCFAVCCVLLELCSKQHKHLVIKQMKSEQIDFLLVLLTANASVLLSSFQAGFKIYLSFFCWFLKNSALAYNLQVIKLRYLSDKWRVGVDYVLHCMHKCTRGLSHICK